MKTVKSKDSVKIYHSKINLSKKIFALIEDYLDKKAIRETDFRRGKDFEEVVKGLN